MRSPVSLVMFLARRSRGDGIDGDGDRGVRGV
jgi:hypothetical protein